MTEAELVDGATTLRTLTFKYDPFGRRVQKLVAGLAPQVPVPLTTTYTYDGEDIVLQTESDGTATTTTQFVHGPGIDEPLAMVRDGQSYYYHADGLGSVVAISDSAQNVVERYSYDAFGMVTASDPGFDNAYAYTGREWDKELGLYYYRARYYDPMEGRFVSKDPIGLAGEDVNFYRYVGNDTINFIDPNGPLMSPSRMPSTAGLVGFENGSLQLTTVNYTNAPHQSLRECYCDNSSLISQAANGASLAAATVIIASGGVATPEAGAVAMGANLVSYANAGVSYYVCGEQIKPSTITSFFGPFMKQYSPMATIADSYFTYKGK